VPDPSIHQANRPVHRVIVVNTGPMDSLALFDLDNTLLDREKAFALWVDRFIDTNGLDRDAAEVIDRADADGFAPRDAFFDEIKRELDIATAIDQLLEAYHVEYPSLFSADPGMVEGIRLLRASGFKVGVVTNGPASQWAKLEATGITDEFDAVCISALVGSWKPDSAIFNEAARLCEVPLSGWMVGDSAEADIGGGSNAGLKTIWMARGRKWTSDGIPPDHVVDSIPQAVSVILEANQRRP
jgi:HAD superfamily hydrolase (TIGR01549 family)